MVGVGVPDLCGSGIGRREGGEVERWRGGDAGVMTAVLTGEVGVMGGDAKPHANRGSC